VCATARATAAELDLDLDHVTVIHADAGSSSTYAGTPRADVVVMSGVFWYFGRRDLRRTVRGFRQLCAPGAAVLFNFGSNPRFTLDRLRREFIRTGFREVTATRHDGRVGGVDGLVIVQRMTAEPEPLRPGRTWFRFRHGRAGPNPPMRRLVRATKTRVARVVRAVRR